MASSRKDHRGRVLRKGEYDRTSIDGRYRYQYSEMGGGMIYATTLEELREKEKQLQKDFLDGINSKIASSMTLNALFYREMKTRTNLRESTRFNYLSSWDSMISGNLGKMKVCDIKNLNIRQLYTKMENEGVRKNTIKFIHNMIRFTLDAAVQNDLIRKNPASGVKYGGEVKEKKALTRIEQESLLNFLSGENIYNVYLPMVIIMIGTGLRVSELCGLTWEDIDFKENTINVNKQLLKTRGKAIDGKTLYIERTKTENGTRIIPMTMEVHKAFREQQLLMLNLGRKNFVEVDGISNFIFVTKNHFPFSVTNVNFILKNIVNAHNKVSKLQLPQFCAHVLRHTAATRMIECGMSPKAVQTILGHSSIQITMDIYVNLDGENLQEEMKKMERTSRFA